MKQEIEREVPELPPTHSETVGMTLLCELQPAIAKAMDLLGGKKPTKSVTDGFYFYAAKHINIAVDTFILFRGGRLRAVRAKPHLFSRVAYSQTLESDRWLGGVARRRAIPYTPVYGSPQWQAFKTRCASEFGADNVVDARLDSYAAAKSLALKRTTRLITALTASLYTERLKL